MLKPLITALILVVLLALPASADFSVTQLTQTSGDARNFVPSLNEDGTLVAFISEADPVPGLNQDGNLEVFLDRLPGPILQVTNTVTARAGRVHLTRSGSHIFFTMDADLTGENPDLARQLFRYSIGGRVIEQLTHLPAGSRVDSVSPNADGSRVAFSSRADVVDGLNDDGNRELFLWTQAGFQQLTNTTEGESARVWMSGDGRRIALDSTSDLTGDNPDGKFNIFLWDEASGFSQITTAERVALGPVISDDGNVIVFEDGQIHFHDVAEGTTRTLTPTVTSGPGSVNPSLSRTGDVVTFLSTQDLVAGSNTDLSAEWFTMDTQSNEITQVTVSSGDDAPVFFGSTSGDGRTIVFDFNRDLLGENPDENREIFIGRQAGCISSSTKLCLNDARFKVEALWEKPTGETGVGSAVRLTNDTGYFWFFNSANVEMVIKVLRGCPSNNHYWVFAGGLTNVEVNITVTDTSTGDVKTYTNPLREPFQPIQDTDAFATCP